MNTKTMDPINSLKQTGVVFNIQRFSTQDGPGIRTTVFMKGCPLKCLWCCNPESQHIQQEIIFSKRKCIHCNRCLMSCPEGAITVNGDSKLIDRTKCNLCGRCVNTCFSNALEIIGEKKTVQEIMEQIDKDQTIYRNSGGGVTLSGGEPTFQPDFSATLLEACHSENIHTAIETCGYAPWEQYQKILPFVDLFLFDIKYMDNQIHQQLTGQSNDLILKNLEKLAKTGKQIIVRLPLIPDFNMSSQNFDEKMAYLKRIGISVVHILPYHKLGVSKYEQLGLEYQLSDVKSISDIEIDEIKTKYEQAGMQVTLFNHG